jgi:molybdate transport system ATP-binding protein
VLHAELAASVGGIELHVELRVSAGECLALAGPSGAGKTTVLRMIAGTQNPARGRVACDEQVWLDSERRVDLPPERRRCGYVPQEHALFPHLPAWKNVAYGLGRLGRAERRRRALELLERFGLGQRADARPQTLSGGERQRVALARALAITHAFHEGALRADRVAVIDRGAVIQEGRPEELAAAPRSAFVAEFTGSVVLTGRAHAGPGPVTVVELDGGGTATATDPGEGQVAISVFPWEITLGPRDEHGHDSAQNRLIGRVHSLTAVGNRVRVGLEAGQPLVAEVTQAAADDLGLRVGLEVAASWKATATRVTAR